jgi:hypothetical protein
MKKIPLLFRYKKILNTFRRMRALIDKSAAQYYDVDMRGDRRAAKTEA